MTIMDDFMDKEMCITWADEELFLVMSNHGLLMAHFRTVLFQIVADWRK